MTTQTTAAPSATPVNRGFPGVVCLACGSENTVSIGLDDVCTLHCSECDNDMSPEDVRGIIGVWQRVLAWVEQAPAVE